VPPTRHIAVAASAAYPDLGPDWPLLRAALADRSIAASAAVWSDPAVDWDSYDLVVANGAWDNIHRPDEFLGWADEVARRTRLVNSPAILRWNLDKHYLAALSAAGVPIVPTIWLAPGDPDMELTEGELPDGEFVVKPTISGGGQETARYAETDHAAARAHISRLLARGRSVMVQPYQAAVDALGEVALIYLGGRFSHAINKGPLLQLGAPAGAPLWPNEVITAATPTADQFGLADEAMAAAEHLHGATTYGRVDLVGRPDGTPAVLELELLDPALFFEFSPPAAARFAEVLSGILG